MDTLIVSAEKARPVYVEFDTDGGTGRYKSAAAVCFTCNFVHACLTVSNNIKCVIGPSCDKPKIILNIS